MGGALKVFWRSRKHDAIAEREQAERLAYSEAWRHRPRLNNDTVPFGANALKGGIEVEGVWISQPTTPLSTVESLPKPSGDAAVQRETIADIKAAVDLALAQPRPAPPTQIMHPAMRHTMYEEARGREEPRGRSRRKSNLTTYALPVPEAHPALKDIDALYLAPLWARDESLANSTPDSGSDDVIVVSQVDSVTSPKRAQAERRHKSTGDERQRSVDFTLIDKHRHSQAAETGQLKARPTKTLTIDTGLAAPRSQSARTSPAPANRRAETIPQTPSVPADYLTQSLPLKTTPSAKGTPVDSRPHSSFTSTQHLAELEAPLTPQAPAQRTQSVIVLPMHASEALSPAESLSPHTPSTQNVASFVDFVQNTPLSTPITFWPHESRDYSSFIDNAFNGETRAKSVAATERQSITALEGPPVIPAFAELEDTSAKPPAFEKVKRSQDPVIRGRGTGFEILKPGSLLEKEEQSRPEQQRLRTAPPVSIQNFSRPRATSPSQSRKLRKRPASIESRGSSRSTSTTRSRFSFIQLLSRRDSALQD